MDDMTVEQALKACSVDNGAAAYLLEAEIATLRTELGQTRDANRILGESLRDALQQVSTGLDEIRKLNDQLNARNQALADASRGRDEAREAVKSWMAEVEKVSNRAGVLLAHVHENAHLSEGQVVKALGGDRVAIRIMLDDWIEQGIRYVAAARQSREGGA